MSDPVEYDEAEARREEHTYRVPSMVERRRLVVDTLALGGDERVLSIGCGPGFEPAELATAVDDRGTVVAIDRSPAMLSLAAQRCGDRTNVSLARANAVSLPMADKTVDAAAAVQVYEYIDNLSEAIAELARVLRPSGRAVVYDTDFDSLVWHASDAERMNRVLEAWNDHCPRPHLGSRLTPYLRNAGLTIDSVHPYSIVNTRLHENTFVYHFMQFVKEYVDKHDAISSQQTKAWADDLHTIDDHNETFFSLTQYLYLVRKEA